MTNQTTLETIQALREEGFIVTVEEMEEARQDLEKKYLTDK